MKPFLDAIRQFDKAKLGWFSSNREQVMGVAAMKLFKERWNPEPLRRPVSTDAPRFLILNHFYDQDIQAYAQADLDCGIWVLPHETIWGIREIFGPGSPGLGDDSNSPLMAYRTNASRLYIARPAVKRMIRDARPDAELCLSLLSLHFQ